MRLGAFLLATALSAPAAAYAVGPTCGFDCTDGAYTACNDSFPTGMPSTANCSASLGSCTGEAFCASFGDSFPPSAFPLSILRIYLVAASNNVMDAAMQFDLELYQETGQPTPGARIGNTINLAIAGSQVAATVVDFQSIGVQPPVISTPGRFRICFRKQFDMGHNICLDDANPPSAPGRNWAHVRIALDPNDPCGSAITGNEWYASDNPFFPQIQGDFIIRPDILPASAAGLPGAGACPGGEDAGVPDAEEPDAGAPDAEPADAEDPMDAGEADVGPEDAAAEDAAALEDAAADGGAEDAAAPADAGENDAGTVPDAGAFSDATPGVSAPPPSEGCDCRATHGNERGTLLFGLIGLLLLFRRAKRTL